MAAETPPGRTLVHLLYWGAPGAGKEANLEALRARTPEHARPRLVSVRFGRAQGLLFERRWGSGKPGSPSVRLHCYAFTTPPEGDPGACHAICRADAVILVAGSTLADAAAARASLAALHAHFDSAVCRSGEIPLVIEYNQRDRPGAATVEELNGIVNPEGGPWTEAVATLGDGVPETLELALALLREPVSLSRSPSLAVAPPAAEVFQLVRSGDPRCPSRLLRLAAERNPVDAGTPCA